MDLKIETPAILTKIVAQLFEVVLQQQHFASVYAMFCREVSRALLPAGRAARARHSRLAKSALHARARAAMPPPYSHRTEACGTAVRHEALRARSVTRLERACRAL